MKRYVFSKRGRKIRAKSLVFCHILHQNFGSKSLFCRYFFTGLTCEKTLQINFSQQNFSGENSYLVGVKVQNMKMDFNTGGTWRRVG